MARIGLAITSYVQEVGNYHFRPGFSGETWSQVTLVHVGTSRGYHLWRISHWDCMASLGSEQERLCSSTAAWLKQWSSWTPSISQGKHEDSTWCDHDLVVSKCQRFVDVQSWDDDAKWRLYSRGLKLAARSYCYTANILPSISRDPNHPCPGVYHRIRESRVPLRGGEGNLPPPMAPYQIRP